MGTVMGVSFLVPLFLAGAAAVAIPVVIHLTQRSRGTVVPFPSLMFLRRIPFRSSERRRIRHPLLFSLRALAILLLAAAFARPYLRERGVVDAPDGRAREIVVLVDESYSMRYGDRWERALDAARSAIDGMGPQDRASVVFFSDRARATGEGSVDPAVVRAALAGVEPGYGTTSFAPGLRMADRILTLSDRPLSEVHLITDLQQSGWNRAETGLLPAGTNVIVTDVASGTLANSAVSDVSIRRRRVEDRERITISARVANLGATDVTGLAAELLINGLSVETVRVDLATGRSESIAFAETPLPPGTSTATVRIVPATPAADLLDVDDEFHFTVSPGQVLSIQILDSDRGRSDRSLFVGRALSIGDEPPLDTRLSRVGSFDPAGLAGRSVVVLNDSDAPTGAGGEALAEWVANGGGLIVALGVAHDRRRWTGRTAELLPARTDEVVERSGGATLASLDYSHPVFEPFREPGSGDFSAGRFFRYRRIAPDTADQVLARFDDGSPALIERRFGDGRVLVWASSLDRFWNDLPLQPVFLPFVHRLARYAAAYEPERGWRTVGSIVDVAQTVTEIVVTEPSGDRFSIEPEVDRDLEVRQPGFYSLRLVDAPIEDSWSVAVNPDLRESDLTPVDAEELAAAIVPASGEDRLVAGAGAMTVEERESQQSVWWYLIMAAGVMLILESWLSNRISRTRGAVVSSGSRTAPSRL